MLITQTDENLTFVPGRGILGKGISYTIVHVEFNLHDQPFLNQ